MLNTENSNWRRGLTLIELLIVFAIIGILAAISLPVITRPRGNAERTACLNNVRQIDVAMRLYADDHGDAVVLPSGFPYYDDWYSYKWSVKSYLSLAGTNSPAEKIFACPADKDLCLQAWTGFNSYAFNSGNRINARQYPNLAKPGIAGMRLSAVKNPARTLLILEASARFPYSWHKPEKGAGSFYSPGFDDSMNVLGFVDGHVNFSKMYWNGIAAACMYDPPDSYDYKWSGN